MLKKRILPLMLAFSVIAGCDDDRQGTVKIAVAGPFTGTGAANGDLMREGALHAAGHINAQGGILGRPVQIVFEDDACSPKEAVSVANRIVGQKIRLVFGHFCSPATLAASPVYAENGMLQLTLSQANGVTAGAHPNLIRFNAAASDISARMIDLVDRADHGRIAIIHEKTGAGQDIARTLATAFEAKGRAVLTGDFSDDDKDFSAIATKIRFYNPGITIVAGAAGKTGEIIRQMREHGYRNAFLTPGTGSLPDVANIAGCLVDGVYTVAAAVSRTRLDETTARMKDTALLTWAGIEAMANAADKARSLDPALMRAQFAGVGVDTLIGPVSVLRDGNLANPPVMVYRWGCKEKIPVLEPFVQ